MKTLYFKVTTSPKCMLMYINSGDKWCFEFLSQDDIENTFLNVKPKKTNITICLTAGYTEKLSEKNSFESYPIRYWLILYYKRR